MLATLLVLLFGHGILCTGQTSLRKTGENLIYSNPPFISCHASTIVELTSGRFMVASFGGTREGNKDVCIWLSVQENGQWAQPVKIADGIINDSLRHPCWNPVLFKSNNGKLFLFYKVGPSPSTWWGMVRTSFDNGKTWTSPKKLPDGILGPVKNKPVQLASGVILSPSSSESEKAWKAHIEMSADEGETWKLIPVDNESDHDVIQPSILVYPGNKLQILCRSKENFILEAFSKDNGRSWGLLTRTNLPNPNSGTDAVTLENGWQVLVYNPTIIGKNDRSKLNVAISKDGKKWADQVILENEEEGEFSYPAIIEARDGKIHITYTYNRKNVKHVILEKIK